MCIYHTTCVQGVFFGVILLFFYGNLMYLLFPNFLTACIKMESFVCSFFFNVYC
jgi:hypothetical protein